MKRRIMKRYLYKKFIGVTIVSVAALCPMACSHDNPEYGNSSESGSCPLIFDAEVLEFETGAPVRSGSWEWKDKANVYLLFSDGEKKIDGKAVYNKNEDIWTLYYNGILPSGTASVCDAYYLNDVDGAGAEKISLSYSSAVYSDHEGSYSKTPQGVRVSVSLVPASGRIRFKGEKGKDIKVSGLETFCMFTPAKGELAKELPTVSLKVGDDGFTPYIYASFPKGSRALKLAYGNYSFSTECENGVLGEGQSGYMDIPTEEAHNGWNVKVISLPTLEKVAVSEIGKGKATLSSKVRDAGNGNVTDCGFCYSTSPSPTVNDKKVSYGTTAERFGKTITDLTENTTYYVRAYAVNELGVGYSEETSFTTLAVTAPSLSPVTMVVISNTSAEVEAAVASLGNGTLQDAGFAYSTSPYPTVETGKLSCGKTETLKATITGLKPETKYYVRAYAVNEKGTSYGEEKSFTTSKHAVNPYTTIEIETSYGYCKFDMATVAGGKFGMGSQGKTNSEPNYDGDSYTDESPVHNVTLSKFLIGKTVVTQKLWYVVMGSYPALTTANGLGEDFPVYNVTYSQCLQFIEKLNRQTGKKFRLPTEAEWEFAARGGVNGGGLKYSGSSVIGSVAWYSGNSGGKLHEVAKRDANELNIYDMSGNVWEWCSDWYGNYSVKDQTNPTGPATGSVRVIRGGCYSDAARECRVSVRSSAAEGSALPTLGLRLVMTE